MYGLSIIRQTFYKSEKNSAMLRKVQNIYMNINSFLHGIIADMQLLF